MMRPFFLTTAAVAASLAAAATAQPVEQMMAFAGHWRVTGVAVSSDGVQALSDNDPSLMGERLTVSKARRAWDQPTATHDSCVNPPFTRLGTSAPAELRPQLGKIGLPRSAVFSIRCHSGSWGPGDTAMRSS